MEFDVKKKRHVGDETNLELQGIRVVESQLFVAGIRQHVAAAARAKPPEEGIGDAATIRDHVLRVLRDEFRKVRENAAAENG